MEYLQSAGYDVYLMDAISTNQELWLVTYTL